MQKFINLEETPFIDLRNKKNVINLGPNLLSKDLSKFQDGIQYKIHTSFNKYDVKPDQISNQSDQKIISEIIKAARNQFRLGFDLQTSTKFKELSLKHVDMVIKYLKEDNPQAAFIALRAQTYNKKYCISLDKFKQIAKKTLYPLLLSQVQSILISSVSKQKNKQISLGLEYLDLIVKGGLPEGFIWKGLFQSKLGDGKKAYEMFKNAEKLGYEPVSYKYLGQLFMGKNNLFSPNVKLADKYFTKAKKAAAFIQSNLEIQIGLIQAQKKIQKQKADSIKSTQDTRSVQLANFLFNKMIEYKNSVKEKDMHYVGQTWNVTNPQSVASLNEPKTFFIVFSPAMFFPGRHFLVKDINGNLEYISIYNWDQVPIEKLKLLHEVGTKIVLNEYTRKVGSGDLLPIYRVDNPNSVEFYKRTQKHTITDKQFRNFAKNLFQRSILDKAMTIYEYMIMKGSEEMQIVYSNMGVIYERQKNISEAIKCYQNSLKIKKFNKSQIRLANIHIKNKQFDKAQKIIREIQSAQERQQLEKQIQKLNQKESDASNFSKTVKNKHHIKKQINNQAEEGLFKMCNSNPTFMINIREDRWSLLYYQKKYEKALSVNGLPQEKYLDFMQSIFNSVENKILNKETVQKFLKMTQVSYELKFGTIRYPYSASYLAIVMPKILDYSRQSILPQDNSIHYMAQRQNYLENRIEDTCLMLQEKGQYKGAEQIYRYSGNYCAPFNVKVAEMLFLQGKYEQCEKYCITTIQFMSQFQIVKFFKYISGLAVWHLKSLIRQEKYETAAIKGEQYIKEFQKKNPKLTYEDHMFKNGVFKFIGQKALNIPQIGEVKDIVNANKLIQNIYRQIIRAFISLKEPVKARQYLPKVMLKKQTSNDPQIVEQYYQTKILELLVIKLQNSQQAIKQIDALIKQINKDKNLESKQLYFKFLLKEKLNLLLETEKTSEAIKQSQEIVKINSVNFFFVKNRLFSFIKKNSSKTFEILDKIKSSETLNCIWPELCQRSKDYLQKSIDQKQQKQTENILVSLQKLDLDLQPEDEEDKMQEEEVSKQAERFSFTWAEKQKTSDFQDELYDEEYQNEICRFQGKNGLTYIVIFDKYLRSSLQVAEERRFVSAADHLCHRENGSTGIKIFGSQIRLKIRGSGRLTGKLIDNPADPKIKFCHFIKRQKHDDYKRHGNK